jgi:hypothetical protein
VAFSGHEGRINSVDTVPCPGRSSNFQPSRWYEKRRI